MSVLNNKQKGVATLRTFAVRNAATPFISFVSAVGRTKSFTIG